MVRTDAETLQKMQWTCEIVHCSNHILLCTVFGRLRGALADPAARATVQISPKAGRDGCGAARTAQARDRGDQGYAQTRVQADRGLHGPTIAPAGMGRGGLPDTGLISADNRRFAVARATCFSSEAERSRLKAGCSSGRHNPACRAWELVLWMVSSALGCASTFPLTTPVVCWRSLWRQDQTAMVQLLDSDIQTREVRDWTGLHLFHFAASSCSQKTRIFLNLKGADWTSHEVNLPNNENFDPWYLGINPRGLVPTLVIDGEVHIESNDIIQLLDQRLPGARLIPAGMEGRVEELLKHEDDLHLDIRTLTFRFTQPRGRVPKSEQALAKYRAGGTGTVGGEPDPDKVRELDFWETVARDGITDQAVRRAAGRLRAALEEVDRTLAQQPCLLGVELSVVDIAWFIYVNRLTLCGYPVARLHPNVATWFDKLKAMPAFAAEIIVPPQIRAAIDDNHRRQAEAGASLEEVAGLT